jgi:hypothetical protein
MRSCTRISSNLILALTAALTSAGMLLSTGEAGDMFRSPAETGYPAHLINRPACGTGEIFDELRHCVSAGTRIAR